MEERGKILIDRRDFEICRLRDDVARGLNPSNTFEVMLVTVIAENYRRRAQALKLLDKLMENPNILDEGLEKLKFVQRMVKDAERDWRASMADFYRAQRNRLQMQKQMQFNPELHIRQYPPKQSAQPPESADWPISPSGTPEPVSPSGP